MQLAGASPLAPSLTARRVPLGASAHGAYREDVSYVAAMPSVVRARTLSPAPPRLQQPAPAGQPMGYIAPSVPQLSMAPPGAAPVGAAPLGSLPLASSRLASSPLASSPSPVGRGVGPRGFAPCASATQLGLAQWADSISGSPVLEQRFGVRQHQASASALAGAPMQLGQSSPVGLGGASPAAHNALILGSPKSVHRCVASPQVLRGQTLACEVAPVWAADPFSPQRAPQPERPQRRSYVAASPGHDYQAAPPVLAPLLPAGVEDPVARTDMRPWLRAARDFELNDDFDISAATLGERQLDLPGIMSVMKRESAGKRTIQALADKMMLHRMLDNLNVPQLPALLSIEGKASWDQVAHFVDTHLSEDGCPDVVVKPTHLSNGAGVLVLSQVRPEERDQTISYLINHMEQYMGKHAGEHESLALQSLKPGFMIQPRYQSVVGFKTPMELRVIALWGKVRLGLWWWGRTTGAPGEAPQRNVWLIRRPAHPGQLTAEDSWEAIHDHPGGNPGFEAAVALFERHMSAIAATTEAVATAFGAPFLRADFFVGSAQWGCRLNEVAYGCGCDYRFRPEGCPDILDDAPVMAKILSDGMAVCSRVTKAKHILARVGAQGGTYEDLLVAPLPKAARLGLPAGALREAADLRAKEESSMPEELCVTVPRFSSAEGAAPTGLGLSVRGGGSPRSSPVHRARGRSRMRQRVEMGSFSAAPLPGAPRVAGSWCAPSATAASMSPVFLSQGQPPSVGPPALCAPLRSASLEAAPQGLLTPRMRPSAEPRRLSKVPFPGWDEGILAQHRSAVYESVYAVTPTVKLY